jgi:carnitine O-acetyltransferase
LIEADFVFQDGFFDSESMLRAIQRGEMGAGAPKASEIAEMNTKRREIGKKLRLSEY